jgi:hypothetical protein
MISRGFTPAAIAEIESISERRVFQLLAIDCPDEAAPAGAAYLADPEQGAEAPDARATAKPMTRRMMLDRAWTAAHEDFRLSSLDVGQRWLWLTIVLTINRLGDQEGLFFGEATDEFESRADFLSMLGADEAFLTLLLRRRVLVEVEGGGIGLPDKLGLKRDQPKPRAPLPDMIMRGVAARQAARPLSPGQRSIVLPIPGGAGDAEIFAENACNNFSGQAGAAEMTGAKFQEEISPCAASLSTSTATQVIESSSEGSSRGSGEDTRARTENFSEIFIASENFSAGAQAVPTAPMVPPWVTAAAELGEVVGLTRPITVTETETVRTWLETGLSLDALRGIIHTVLKRENRPASPSLTYFAGAVTDAVVARTAAPVQAAKPVAEPAPPLSDADKAIEAMIAVPSKAWLNDRSMPFPPTAGAVKEAYAAGREADVRRWLDLFAAWRRAGYPGGSKPPDFNFFIRDPRKYKEQMAEMEGELSRFAQDDDPGSG